MRILVVDDREENLAAARKGLAGHEVVTACTLDEALAALAQDRFDAVLTDLCFPETQQGRGPKIAKAMLDMAEDPEFIRGTRGLFGEDLMRISMDGSGKSDPCGTLVALECLKHGIPFTLVTFGSGHGGVVAMVHSYILRPAGMLYQAIQSTDETKTPDQWAWALDTAFRNHEYSRRRKR
jgi:CheY-like chemotaxis protein